MNDPFSMLEQAVWLAAEASPHVTALVKLGNRIKFHQGADMPLKTETQPGDLPELVMFPSGGDINPVGVGTSSHNHSFVQRYAFIITTDKLRTDLDRSVNPVKWALLRAMLRYPAGPGGWMGLPFCRMVRAGSFSDQVSLPQAMAGLERPDAAWKAVLSMEFGLVFSRSEIT